MLTVKYVYTDTADQRKLESKLNLLSGACFHLETYNEEHPKEKKKAIMIKASCGTRLTPFIAVYDKGELVKAFYTDVNECTFENFVKWMPEYHAEHGYSGGITITKVDGKEGAYLRHGESQWGTTKCFAEGMPLRINNTNDWYHTSNVVQINWEEGTFKTLNSIYLFKLHDKANEERQATV